MPPKGRAREDGPKRRKKGRARAGRAEELVVAPPAVPHAPPADERGVPVRRILRGIEGARLCYGEPLDVDGRTVITVARVRAGGAGLTGATAGGVDAAPLGFIEVTAGEARFHAIDDPERGLRALRAAAGAATTLLGALALGRRRRVAGLLARSRR